MDYELILEVTPEELEEFPDYQSSDQNTNTEQH